MGHLDDIMQRRGFLTRTLAAALGMALPCGLMRADDDPTEPAVKVVEFISPDQPLDKLAPASSFISPDGERIWNAAKARALTESLGRPGGKFDFSNIIPDNFRSAVDLSIEDFASGEPNDTLRAVIRAKEAVREGKLLKMTEMRLVFLKPEEDPAAAKKERPEKAVKPAAGKAAAKAVDKSKAAAAANSIPPGSRVVIRAPKCNINLETGEGHAFGGADIKVFPKPEAGKEPVPMMIMASSFMRWRSWNEAGTGSTEIVMYTCSNDPSESDPEVTVKLAQPQPDGSVFSMDIRGRGMIFESGEYDRPTPVYDDEGRTAGASTVARQRAIFHNAIKTEMTSSAVTALIPFQGAPKDPAKKDDPANGEAGKSDDPAAKLDKKASRKKQQAPVEPYKTVVSCDGPAIFDMAYVPRQKWNPLVDATTGNPNPGESVELELKEIALAKRFDFLNRVRMVKTPITEKPRDPSGEDMATHMACGDLRIQYPAGATPSMSVPPDFAEAIGGVKMFGYMQPEPTEPGKPPDPPQPFSVECKRMYMDGPADNMFLIGPEGKLDRDMPLASVKYTFGAGFAQQFCFRQKTQTMTMPSMGKKMMIFHGGAMGGGTGTAAAKPGEKSDSMFSGDGDTIMTWSGPMSREPRHIPVKHQKDRIKEVLTLSKEVIIEQRQKPDPAKGPNQPPVSGLKLYAEHVRLYRDLETNQVEYLFANEKVDVFMNELQASGDTVTVERTFEEKPTGKTTPKGEPEKTAELIKNVVTILGNRKQGIKADVFRGGGNAIRSDKFVIDMLTENFTAFGGAVAVVKSDKPPEPPAPKPEAAQGAGALVASLDFETGGDISIQCDGPLIQNKQENFIAADGNVFIKQTGLTLKASYVKIVMDDTPAPAPDKNANPAPGDKADANATHPPGDTAKTDADKAKDSASQTPGGSFFSGELKSLECIEMVELVAHDTQFVHCDNLTFNAKEQLTVLKCDDPEDDVRVYLHDDSDASTKVLLARESLTLDRKTGKFTHGGRLLILPYRSASPAPRGAEFSPGAPLRKLRETAGKKAK